MPNGKSKNWIRFLAAIDGFRARYGRWPVRVRVIPGLLEDLTDRLTPKEWTILKDKVKLIPDGAPMIAEDDSGNTYNYGQEGFSPQEPDVRARDWMGVYPEFYD